MNTAPWLPGVPAAGHIARNGFWHPGAAESCPKQPCATDHDDEESH